MVVVSVGFDCWDVLGSFGLIYGIRRRSAEDRLRDVKGNPELKEEPEFLHAIFLLALQLGKFLYEGPLIFHAFCSRKIKCAFRLAVPLFKAKQNVTAGRSHHAPVVPAWTEQLALAV